MSQVLAKKLVIPVHAWPAGELLAEVPAKGGDSVLDLSRAVGKKAKMAIAPQLHIGGLVRPKDQLLHELNVGEDSAKLFAEPCPAVLTTSSDCTAKVWNVLTGECILTISGHTAAVNAACATPDLKWVATASDDGTAKVWAVDGVMQTAMLSFTLEGHERPVHSVAFSHDGRSVVTGGADRTARIWNMKTGQCVRTLEGHVDELLSAVFTPDGRSVKTTSRDRTCKTWEVETGRCKGTSLGQDPVKPTQVTPDGKFSLVPAQGAELEVRDVNSQTSLHLLQGHEDEILWSSFLALNSPRLATRASSTTNSLPPTATMKLSKSGSAPTRALSASATLVLSPKTKLGTSGSKTHLAKTLNSQDLEHLKSSMNSGLGATQKIAFAEFAD